MTIDIIDNEDIFCDALEFLGEKPQIDDSVIHYGPLVLMLAPKQGKANTLLADHLFSPAIFLAERIERNLLDVSGKTVIELGAGSALPSLLLSTKPNPPSLIVVTDYPDELILGNVKNNVAKNQGVVSDGCVVKCEGYEWGADTAAILSFSKHGYDVVILSDLLHFVDSHDALVSSIQKLLAKNSGARAYVGAGNYTLPHICENFLRKAQELGLMFEEIVVTKEDRKWQGTLEVNILDREALEARKNNCRYWVGRWADC